MRDPSDIWTSKALSYDQACLTPPAALLDLLTQLIGSRFRNLGCDEPLRTRVSAEKTKPIRRRLLA